MPTELFRFTIEERNGERETEHECYVKANGLEQATTAAVEYTKDFYGPSVQEKDEDGSLYWRTPGGELEWRVGSITPIACITITPINAPVIYLPLPETAVVAD